MVNQTTNIAEDGGCSGAKAFFTFGWSDNKNSDTIKHEGFVLEISLTNFRTSGQMWGRKKILVADWKNSVNRQLEEYDANNYEDYKKKKAEADKNKKKDRSDKKEYATEEPHNPEQGDFKKLFDEIQEIKKDKTKPLEMKEKDMQAIIEKIDAKSKEEIEKINERVEKQEEQNLRIANELSAARKNNDKALENKLIAVLNQGKREAAQMYAEKKEVPNVDLVKELLKEEQNNSPQFNWKSRRTWGFITLAIVALFTIFLLLMWIWNKIITPFTNK